jgi:hypothetical protein
MKTQIILVDWENVQPELLPALNLDGTRVLVFIGPQHHKLPFPLVQAVQKLGDRAQYVQVSKQGNDALDMRRAIAKAITLLESTRADHRAQADELLTALLPHTGKSLRLGISGVPGVGKSTFIEALGLYLIGQGPPRGGADH